MTIDLNELGKGIHRHIQEQDFQHGVMAERERREAWLDRVRTWYPEKADIWMEGYETAETRIIKLLEEMFDEWADIRLETLIALIKGENK